MKKILVTGSQGFIGRRLYQELLKYDDVELKCIDSEYFIDEKWTESLKNILDDFVPDVVFHVGACSDTLENDVNYMFTRNYESTKIISKWCSTNFSKLIYSSSAANYGINNLYPSNLYGWSKYVAEDIVTFYGGISLRYFNVYGPGEDDKGKMSSVSHQMYNKYKNGETISLFPGKPTRDFIYINDVINANIYAWQNYDIVINNQHKYYEVGSGESRTFEDVLNILEIPFIYTDEKNIPYGYQFYTKSNCDLWMPNWKPIYNIEKGLSEYKEYLDNR